MHSLHAPYLVGNSGGARDFRPFATQRLVPEWLEPADKLHGNAIITDTFLETFEYLANEYVGDSASPKASL